MHTIASRAPPLWVSASLLSWLGLALRHARRAGPVGAELARDGDEWYLAVPRRGASAPAERRDPLTLVRPRYRSSWLLVLELVDATGRARTLDVWADAVDPVAFSALHLACLLDAAAERPR